MRRQNHAVYGFHYHQNANTQTFIKTFFFEDELVRRTYTKYTGIFSSIHATATRVTRVLVKEQNTKSKLNNIN